MQFEIVPSHIIDKQKWDDCLKKSSNTLVYATSVYLDNMADSWYAIIADDYDFIMPVPWRKKLGIKYSYTVPFIQQLGVFGQNIQPEIITGFINFFHQHFKYGDYSFNYANAVDDANFSNNYILSLASKHSILKHFYHSHLEKNLHKANNFSFDYSPAEIGEAIEMFKTLYAKRLNKTSISAYKHFTELCIDMNKENKVIVRKMKLKNQTLSIVLLLKYEERLYNVMSATSDEGRKHSAGPFLYDSIIKEFAQTGLLLDFEGSDIPGIEFFYKGFGAVNQPYKKMHFNNLSYPLRLFKR